MAQPDFIEALQELPLPLNPSFSLGKLRVDKCKIMSSAKRPLWLEWENPDQMSMSMCEDLKIIFKRGDGEYWKWTQKPLTILITC